MKERGRRHIATPDMPTLVPVRDFPGYYVTRSGKMYSVHEISHLGTHYKYATVYDKNGTRTHLAVHRAVCQTFHGPAPIGKPEVRHLNGDYLDNRAENLAWGSHKENGADLAKHGTNYGPRNGQAKLSGRSVRAIRGRKKTAPEYAEKYGVSVSYVYYLWKNKGKWRKHTV